MANYIKIFNDTVLKQSILQGYEAQRTNTNLGKFTMGELAYTRDTGRVFVGNAENNTQPNTTDSPDAQQVDGGILVGNKYLGMIDSKPLGHYSPNNIPLKYGSHNISIQSEGDNFTQQESGVLLEGSIHRKDRGKHWAKNVDYIEKYDAYTGDYMFDIFNNAFILFDKNINPDLPQPQYSKELSENKQTFIDSQGNKIDGEKVSRRTKIIDNSDGTNENLYPIYGDGYVVMRILEPDGVTLGYKDRAFTIEGLPRTSQTEDTKWDNWSHNLLEIKSVPSEILMASMSEDNFYDADGFVKLLPHQKGVEGFSAETFILPQTITFASNYSFITDEQGNKTLSNENPLTLTFSSGIEVNQTKDDYILSVTKKETDDKPKYTVKIAKPYRQSFRIQLHDGLLNPITGENTLYITSENEENNTLALGFISQSTASSSELGSSDPFYIGVKSSYNYHGSATFNQSGSLKASEKWDNNYAKYAKNQINQFDSETNNAINYLKEPLSICWSLQETENVIQSRTANLQYIIKPYLFCIHKTYNGEVTFVDQETNETLPIKDYEKTIHVLGNNAYSDLEKQSSFTFIDGYNSSPEDENPFEGFTDNTLTSIVGGDWSIEETNASDKQWKTTMKQNGNNIVFTPIVLEVSDTSVLKQIVNEPNVQFRPMQYSQVINATSINDTFTDNSSANANLKPNFTLIPAVFSINYSKVSNKIGICETRYNNVSNHLNNYITEDEDIIKIEVSTNDENERLLTWFDSEWVLDDEKYEDFPVNVACNVRNYYQKLVRITNQDEDKELQLIINYQASTNSYNILGLANSKLFTSENTLPYYLKITTNKGVKYILFGDTIQISPSDITMVSELEQIVNEDGTTSLEPIESSSFYVLSNEQFFNEVGLQTKKLYGVSVVTIEDVEVPGEEQGVFDIVPTPTNTILDIKPFVQEHYTKKIDPEIISVNGKKYQTQIYSSNSLQIDRCTSITFLTMNVAYSSATPFNSYKVGGENIYYKSILSAFKDASQYINEQLCEVTYDNSFYNVEDLDKFYGEGNIYPKVNDNASIRFRQVATIYNDTPETTAIRYTFCGLTDLEYGEDKYPLYRDENELSSDNLLYNELGTLIIRQKQFVGDPEFMNYKNLIMQFNQKKIPFFVWSTKQQAVNAINNTGQHPQVLVPEAPFTYGIVTTNTYITKNLPRYQNGYFVPSDIQKRIIIPDNASSVILEVHKSSTSNTTTSIYTAKNKEHLSTSTDEYSFPFSINENGIIESSDNIMSNTEKLIYSSSTNGCQIIEVPLIRTKLDNAKGFCIRINNVSSEETDKLVIRIIGYRA